MTARKLFAPCNFITTTSPFVLGTDIARNRNCPACKNLRRFVANPVDVRRYAKILSYADRFQRDVSQQSRRGDSIVAPGAFRIRSKDACSVNWKLRRRVRPKMETERSREYRQHVTHRSAPSPLVMLQTSACNGNSKTDARAFERNRQPRRRCFYPTLAEDAAIRARASQARPAAFGDGLTGACC